MTVTNNLAQIQQTIKEARSRSDRHTDNITIIAVTKYVTLEKAKEAIEAGIQHIGENRLEGALEKWEAFHGQVKFHFIGSLQSKKAKHLVDKYDYIHSLDRLSLAKELQKRCPDDKKLQCFVQVNASGEKSKSGLAPEETLDFIKKLEDYPSLKVIGLMTMAPYEEDPENTRPVFRRLRELRDEICELRLEHAPCEELSMGMSNDFHIAIEEGATFIRLGSTLVGKE